MNMEQPQQYLYHMVPQNMVGDTLHPLNLLKEKVPELYVEYTKKYEGREHVLDQFIETLQCLWNDVLHFSPIHPEELKKALIDAGMEPKEMKFYQVDPKLLDPEKTTIYLYNDVSREDKMNSDNFSEYNPEKISSYSQLPEKTKEYYKKTFGQNQRPLLFMGVPHILHKGSIDISKFPIIEV